METVAITLSVLGVIAFTSYLGAQFKTSSEGGTGYGAAMKVFFNTVAFTLVLVLPFMGIEIASEIEFEGLETILSISLVPLLFSYLLYLFYLIIVYFEDAVKAIRGKSSINRSRGM